MSNRLLFSHPTGNANVRAALGGLFDAGALSEFQTTVASYPGNFWDFAGRTRFGREFQRRTFDERLRRLTVQHPFRELVRMLAPRLKLNRLCRHESGGFSIDAVYQALDKSTARRLRQSPREFTGVYAFEDGALETHKAARELGLSAIYDLPIGHWRTAQKLMEGEFSRSPEWAGTMPGFNDSLEKLKRKDGELSTATKIIVASRFTADSLKDYPGKLPSHTVVPYGFPDVCPEKERADRGAVTREKPLRIIFVGSLSQRKGIADLFSAVNKLSRHVSLTVIGHKVTAHCPILDRELVRHRWIPSLPHSEILREMRMHDVLAFPSLFEGFGLVISESMSQGTPVITTERTAGPDLIDPQKNGWLIKAGVSDELFCQLEKLVSTPAMIRDAGIQARRTAAGRPWSSYGRELARAIVGT